MYRFEKTRREERSGNDVRNPSFSSTVLDEIYRSIDAERKSCEMKFYTETTVKKQSKQRREEEEEIEAVKLRRARLLEKWMEKKASEKVGNRGFERKLHHDHEQDTLFFSSTSSSSESSSGLLSSSDTESSFYAAKSRTRSSCFAPSRPKPVRTSVSDKTNTEKPRRIVSSEEEIFIKSKSRALKIYHNLKKVKQPISPGGKLSTFLNSLFTTGHGKKTKTTPSFEDANAERKEKSGQASTCSSASSFSRSCLSKTSPSSKLRNGVKRTVRFYPLSVIVDEDSRPCGHKSLYDYEEEHTRIMAVPVSVPTAWKIGVKKNEGVMEKSKRVEEAAREFLKEYHRNQKKSDLISRDDEDDDDDAASYSSSDLFELDHLPVVGNDRYREDLPVYETTYVSTNRAIANGRLLI